jgi:hypothetical protein
MEDIFEVNCEEELEKMEDTLLHKGNIKRKKVLIFKIYKYKKYSINSSE